VVSKDLARWTWLPPALLPDTPYDYNGCWSGAATVTDGNSPVLTYTGAVTCSAVTDHSHLHPKMMMPLTAFVLQGTLPISSYLLYGDILTKHLIWNCIQYRALSSTALIELRLLLRSACLVALLGMGMVLSSKGP